MAYQPMIVSDEIFEELNKMRFPHEDTKRFDSYGEVISKLIECYKNTTEELK